MTLRIFLISILFSIVAKAKSTENYLDKIIENKSDWDVAEPNPPKDCQSGKVIRLLEPQNSFLIGNRIHFFNANDKEQITQELSYPDCDIISQTTLNENILANTTFKKCGKSKKEQIYASKIIFKSDKEFVYYRGSEKCTFRVAP